MFFPGYQLLRCDRVGKGDGGIAIFVSNCLHSRILREFDKAYCDRPEYLIIEVSTVNAYKFLLGSVQTSTVAISLIFFNVCTDLSASYKHSIIFGDFNADVFGVLPH